MSVTHEVSKLTRYSPPSDKLGKKESLADVMCGVKLDTRVMTRGLLREKRVCKTDRNRVEPVIAVGSFVFRYQSFR